MEPNKKETWQQAAQTIVSAGMVPMAVSDTLLELLQNILTDAQAEFISIFDKPSLNIDQ